MLPCFLSAPIILCLNFCQQNQLYELVNRFFSLFFTIATATRLVHAPNDSRKSFFLLYMPQNYNYINLTVVTAY